MFVCWIIYSLQCQVIKPHATRDVPCQTVQRCCEHFTILSSYFMVHNLVWGTVERELLHKDKELSTSQL